MTSKMQVLKCAAYFLKTGMSPPLKAASLTILLEKFSVIVKSQRLKILQPFSNGNVQYRWTCHEEHRLVVVACQTFEEMSMISCDKKLSVHSDKFKGIVQSSIIVESVMIDM